MSIETIPAKYRQPFDLYSDVPHEIVKDYAQLRLSQGESIQSVLQSSYDKNTRRYPEFSRRLIERGKFLEPVNDDLEFIDQNMNTMRTFNAGLALASLALDALAYEVNVEQSAWRSLWTSLPELADFLHLETEDGAITQSSCSKSGHRLVLLGQRAYEELEHPYHELFESVDEAYGPKMPDPQVFRSSYGYLTRFGQKVIYSFSTEERLDAAVSSALQQTPIKDEEANHLLPKRERRRLRKDLRAFHSNHHHPR